MKASMTLWLPLSWGLVTGLMGLSGPPTSCQLRMLPP